MSILAFLVFMLGVFAWYVLLDMIDYAIAAHRINKERKEMGYRLISLQKHNNSDKLVRERLTGRTQRAGSYEERV